MAFKHKDGCKFNGFKKYMICRDPNGPDSSININEFEIQYIHNDYRNDIQDFLIEFNFCPCCGAPKEECQHDSCNTFKAGNYIWCCTCGAIREEFETKSNSMPTDGVVAICGPGKWMLPKKDYDNGTN